MKNRKICIITGSRAEYGLLKPLIHILNIDSEIDLKIVATGMHLDKKFGLTFKDIENDGFHIYRKCDILPKTNSQSFVHESIGKGIIKFSDIFLEMKPDIVVVLGDRFEIFAASIAAYFLKIPIAHIHGGETTEGAFDEGIRHSITKMSHFHFVAAEEYKNRVIQLGEDPARVFMSGALFVDTIKNTKLLSRNEIEKTMNINFKEKNILLTYHPVTLANNSSQNSFKALLSVLNERADINIIFTGPNADPGSDIILKMIKDFIKKNKNRSVFFTSMGHLKYLSCLQFVDAMVGNSSSGITEAPALSIPTINIGDRQKGRIQTPSIINCEPTLSSINSAFELLYSTKFQSNLVDIFNPYGGGEAGKKIANKLKDIKLPKNIKKTFFDLKI